MIIGLILLGLLIVLVTVWVKALADDEPSDDTRICYGCTKCWCDHTPGSDACLQDREVPWEKSKKE